MSAALLAAVLLAAALLAAGCNNQPTRRQHRAERANRTDRAEQSIASSAVRPAPVRPAAGPRVTQLQLPRTAQTGDQAAPLLPEPAIATPLRESLTVQEVGELPRKILRYDLVSQTRQYTLTAALQARVLTEDRPSAAAAAVPTFRETFDLETTAGSPTFYWRGEPVHIEGEAAADRSAALAATPYVLRWKTLLSGRRARFQLDEQRLPTQLTFAEDPLRERSAPEQTELSQRLLGLLVPLPDEPIGLGARWTAVTVLRQGLGVVKQTARYHLVEQAAGRLTLEVDLRRVAEEQLVEAPELPAGTRLELLALFRAVTGRLELELGAPLPIAGALTVEARSHQRITRAGVATELITEDTGTLTLGSSVTSSGSSAPPK